MATSFRRVGGGGCNVCCGEECAEKPVREAEGFPGRVKAGDSETLMTTVPCSWSEVFCFCFLFLCGFCFVFGIVGQIGLKCVGIVLSCLPEGLLHGFLLQIW